MKINNTSTVHQNKVKAVYFGVSGSGKTSAIKTLPHDKTLVISAESGLLALKDTKIDYIDIATDDNGKVLTNAERVNRLGEIVKFLSTEESRKKYSNIVVDSLTEMGEVIAAYWKEKITDKAKTFEIWGNIGQSQINFIKTMRDLPYYNVFFICLEEIDKDEMSRRFVGPDIPGNSAKNFLIPAFDIVMRLTVEADGKRFFQTQPLSTVKAKDRSGALNAQEPVDLGLILSKVAKVSERTEELKNV